jgi:hydroxyethylthiazole kinase-like sugar kinase family protein
MTAEAGCAFARKTKTIVVLKGPITMITDGTHLIYVPIGWTDFSPWRVAEIVWPGLHVAAIVARRRTLKLSLFKCSRMRSSLARPCSRSFK